MDKQKKYFKLLEQRNEAERNRAGFQCHIESYRRMLEESDPRDVDAYDELMEKLHAAEDKLTYWTHREAMLNYKLYMIEQHYYWNET